MTDPLLIGGETVKRGTRCRLDLPIARLITQQMVSLPLIVVHGANPGPTIWLSAALHGDEIHGTEIIRRVLTHVDAKTLSGTILALPVVNVWGFVEGSRYLPDRRDLNRSFPGSKHGSLAGQIAYRMLTEVVARCEYGIDLHAGSDHRINLPQARADLDDAQTASLCAVFGAPVTLHAKQRAGSLRNAAARRGIPCLLYEAGEPHRFDDDAIRCGELGVRRVLRHLGMLTADVEPAISQVARSSYWVRAGRSGILHLDVELGARITAGAPIGVIRDPFGDIAGRVKAREAGIVIGHTLNPLVNRGDAVVHLARTEGTP